MLKKILLSVVCYSLFLLSGCAQNEPMPVIINEYPPTTAPIVKPKASIIRPPGIPANVPPEWVPPASIDNKQQWKGIIIHHSGNYFGDAAHENEYHKSLGWDGLGYDFVIDNGVFEKGYGKSDGIVEVGYRWRQQLVGAHCRPNPNGNNYWNEHTIGICLIGNLDESRPTERQIRSLTELVNFLQKWYNIPPNQIKGHRDIKPTDCPGRNFSLSNLKSRLAWYK